MLAFDPFRLHNASDCICRLGHHPFCPPSISCHACTTLVPKADFLGLPCLCNIERLQSAISQHGPKPLVDFIFELLTVWKEDEKIAL
jgi:hypothetical protein